MKIPSFIDLLDGKISTRDLDDLPLPALRTILQQLQQLRRAVAGASNVPADPLSMALQNPKYGWMDSPHLHYLSKRVADAVHKSKSENAGSALIVTMPPRHAKSSLCSVWLPFWFLAQYPEDAVMMVGYEASFATGWGAAVRRLVELYGSEYNMELDRKKLAAKDWALTTGGGMRTVGAGGGLSGKSAKLLIFDDLMKDTDEARSPIQKQKLKDWWDQTALQRIEPDTTTILIGTRWAEDDIIGHVTAASESGVGHPFEVISMPAVWEDEKNLDTILNRKVGEGLWESHTLASGLKWGREYYQKLKARRSKSTWYCVYQGTPIPAEGNLVDPSWWRWYLPSQLPLSFDKEAQSWDTSLDAEKKGDSRHAGLVGSRTGAIIYVRDGFAELCSITKVQTMLRAWSQIYPGAKAKLIERASAGVALRDTLRATVPGVLAWPPKGRQKGSKEAELDAIIPYIRSGNILLPLNPDGTRPKWADELVAELAAFPRGANDDYVDAISQLVNYLMPGARSTVEADHAAAAALHSAVELTPDQQHTRLLHSIIQKFGAPRARALADHTKKIEKLERHGIVSNRRFRPGQERERLGQGGHRLLRFAGRRSGGMW